jgi:hypothetical protein
LLDCSLASLDCASVNEGTDLALLHALSDLTGPKESHILPASARLMGTWGFNMIRIEP